MSVLETKWLQYYYSLIKSTIGKCELFGNRRNYTRYVTMDKINRSLTIVFICYFMMAIVT
ncbi:hypothetical protein [Caldifermentibacillus hisashii]|uniref:hypothetical protein n=1 Tax=Caldifermentibacillus hisashii TaxID=996558 RepID=UPI0022B9B1E7|nr:hypothetical protein [Caldifermentibacillus hisashii]MDL0421278.1 hypothetical protein [Caldibacillus thermoamylovorans]